MHIRHNANLRLCASISCLVRYLSLRQEMHVARVLLCNTHSLLMFIFIIMITSLYVKLMLKH